MIVRTFQFLILFCFCRSWGIGQTLSGQYIHHEEQINFFIDSLNFDLNSSGGVTSELKGQASYVIVGEYFVLKTVPFKGQRSTYQKKCDRPLGVEVKIVDPVIQGPYKVCYRDFNGKCREEPSSQAATIEIDCVGCDRLKIPFENRHFLVTLVGGHINENKNVVFKIRSQNKTELRIELITTDFETKSFKLSKLRRAEKKLKRKYGENDIKTFTLT